MTGNINSGTSALRKINEQDLPVAEAGCRAPAEILPFRLAHDPSAAAQESPLNDDQELALMNLVKAGDFDTKQNLVTRNLRLVLKSTRRYSSKGVRIFDLLKAGNLGLEHALESFELEGGGRFSAYAARCIRHNIEHTILNWDSRSPANPGKSSHGLYRIVAGGGAGPSPLHLCQQANDQID